MKLTPATHIKRQSGMTLIELTVVILVLLALIAVLFVGARAYKAGADKAACIMNQRNIQQACRSYFNLNPAATAVANTDVIGADKFIGSEPKCPAGAVAYVITGAKDLAVGNRFTACTVDATNHVPADMGTW